MVYISNLSTWEAKTEEFQSKSEASLGYWVRPCLKNT